MSRLSHNVDPNEILRLAGQAKSDHSASTRPCHPCTESDDDDDVSVCSPSVESVEKKVEKNVFDSPELCMEDDDFDDDECEAELTEPVEDGGVRHRAWFITYFTDDLWKPDFTVHKLFRYAVYTREIAPTTKRIHYHCYVELLEGRPFTWLKKQLNIPSANFACRKGTVKQAIMYCTKKRSRYPGFEPVHWGTPSEQGHRTDQDWIVEAIYQGATHDELLRAGKGNVFRMGGMVRLAQQTVQGTNSMDNLIIARRLARAQGLPVPMMSDVKDERVCYENFQKYRGGSAPAECNSLTEALAHVSLGKEAGSSKPSQASKDIGASVKKEKVPTSKSYAKPTGAMYTKNIRPDMQKRLTAFCSSYRIIDGVPLQRAVTNFVQDYNNFVDRLVVQYCKDPKDVESLLKVAEPVIVSVSDDFIEHIESLFEDDVYE